MIERYSLPEMAAVWSQRRRLSIWQQIEVLAAKAWAAEGVVPQDAAEAIAAARPVDPEQWLAREQETRHDVAAFVDVLAAGLGEHGRWVHFGLTSSDVLDTALAVQAQEAWHLLSDKAVGLFESLQRRAVEHRNTAMVGRTHGMWAEPTTFGHKLAGFAHQVARAHATLRFAADRMRVGKLAGAVGTHATVPESVEAAVADALGLAVEPAATQIVARDRHALFLSAVAVAGAVLDRIATEVRHLQRSEVAEVAESFAEGQKGSSAMPHKRNPILSENVSGLARLLRGYAVMALENVPLWHERDISHSSVERVAIPDACQVLDFALARMRTVIDGLEVDAVRMAHNLEAAAGHIHSQAALNALIRNGAGRDEAYRRVQEATQGGSIDAPSLADALGIDPETLSIEQHLAAAARSVDRLAEIPADDLRSGAA